MDKNFTLIVTAENAPLARSLASALSSRAQGMFTAKLSGTGLEPATHYISAGFIDEAIGALLTDANALYAVCQAKQAPITLQQCTKLVTESDVSEEAPFSAMARLNLALVQEAI